MSRQVELQVRLELLSDTIFGSGHSIPGGEDIAVCQDENGYPYLKGTTFKGLLRESMHDLLEWSGGPMDTGRGTARQGRLDGYGRRTPSAPDTADTRRKAGGERDLLRSPHVYQSGKRCCENGYITLGNVYLQRTEIYRQDFL